MKSRHRRSCRPFSNSMGRIRTVRILDINWTMKLMTDGQITENKLATKLGKTDLWFLNKFQNYSKFKYVNYSKCIYSIWFCFANIRHSRSGLKYLLFNGKSKTLDLYSNTLHVVWSIYNCTFRRVLNVPVPAPTRNNLSTVILRNRPISVAFYDAHGDTEDLFLSCTPAGCHGENPLCP